ncbi:MAG: ectoine hydroxylase-related dioxygenase (phytanoyl-CoA dioxygenase family) [Acidimicrobiales bacterium]|jgi:ectoine hydroxylase-related dioxygenase (phytanoyl-CoA dioxygenase family)
MPELERIHVSAGAGAVCEAVERDGACVVEDAVSAEHLTGLNQDLEALIAATPTEIPNPTHDDMIRFYGTETIRLDGIPAKSETFVEFMLDPVMHEICRKFIMPNCHDYLLNVAQLIQIGPGQTAQRLHRDEEAWPHMPEPSLNLEVEALIALTDFTVENGATRVVPGSHQWEPERKPEPHEITQAVMKAGSAVYYLGKTLHGGGANTTQSNSRRGLFYGYVVGWLRTGENMFLTVPIEEVRHMPTRVQELLGYKAVGGLGVVDVGSPMALLN